ncbi:MAG: hypothetical protein HYV27_15885 [Candidatus Hydrogenedentes bacterium]|nr:hypothetical protein [Candidatus Hydrogenedentota bacterium]
MAEHFSDETQRQIRELAADIVGSRAADDATGREMQDHVEDKIRAYLDGEERVSEADALILARKHFGNPKRIKAELSAVHPIETAPAYSHRLLAFLLLQFAAGFTLRVLFALMQLQSSSEWFQWVTWWQLGALAKTVLAYVLIYAVLARWRKQAQSGRRLWFESWSVPGLCALYFVLPLLNKATDLLWIFANPAFPKDYVPSPAWIQMGYAYGMAFAIPLAVTILMLWWCEIKPRNAASGWRVVLLYFVLSNLAFLPVNAIQIGAAGSQFIDGWTLLKLSYLEVRIAWETVLISTAWLFLSELAVAAVGLLLYHGFDRVRTARMRFARNAR